MTASPTADSSIKELAERLFLPQERLGREYVEPAAIAPSPLPPTSHNGWSCRHRICAYYSPAKDRRRKEYRRPVY
jgi:hypothetical protein